MLIADSELEPKGPATPKHRACPECGLKKLRGRPLPCTDDHRCSRVTSGHRCKIAVEPGSDLCDHHRALWQGGNPVKPVEPEPERKPGRPPGPGKISDQARAEIVQKYKDGVTIASLAREFAVSTTAIRHALDKVGARKPAV